VWPCYTVLAPGLCFEGTAKADLLAATAATHVYYRADGSTVRLGKSFSIREATSCLRYQQDCNGLFDRQRHALFKIAAVADSPIFSTG
jgi:hypothetical protein